MEQHLDRPLQMSDQQLAHQQQFQQNNLSAVLDNDHHRQKLANAAQIAHSAMPEDSSLEQSPGQDSLEQTN